MTIPTFGGKRVGVIGTGSSGIQAIPLIAAQADSACRLPTVAQLQRADAQPAVERRGRAAHQGGVSRAPAQVSAYAPAGTPHTTYPKNAVDTDPDERSRPCRSAGRREACCSQDVPGSKTDLAANDIAREFAEARIRDIVTIPSSPKT